jgi:hypothetical protein
MFMVLNRRLWSGYIARMGTEKYIHCTWKALREKRDHLGDLRVDGR